MKNETPFNPLPIPDNLNLALNAGTVQAQASQNNLQAQRPPERKAERRIKANPPGATACGADREGRWRRFIGLLAAKLAEVDRERIKAVLLACGVTAGIVAAVIVAIKLFPVTAVILAALGLGAALRVWERLRYLPRPV